MSNILDEYMNADFGFSAVDEIPQSAQPTPPADDVDGLKDNIERIEANLSQLIQTVNALNNHITDLDDEFDVVKTTTEQEVKDKLVQVEKLIMPLLVNFLKTADKDYIHWPNREATVKAQIDKLLAITRGE